ncbi:glycerophosphodiester phosphodiesterase [Blastococcus deserti]|uniref:Glycerophosphodiester phosphodiesterase n=1 Tax=Blastococcus deserti TaxID=2259033 RepID=A0ABW4X996_9ACTN
MRIVGHRGTPSCPQHPENSLQSIRAALQAGADGVEVDVQATVDGVLVLAHDADLGRVLGTGPGTGPVVARSTFAALRAHRLPNGTRITALTEALDVAADRHAFVVTEVKPETGGLAGSRTARLLAALLDARRLRRPGADRISTSSSDLRTAAALAGHGTVSGAVIVRPHVDPGPVARRARDHGLTDVHLHVAHVRRDPEVVGRVHALGMSVAVGIVDDPDEARLMARSGVDMLCTDDPAGLARRRAGRTRTGSAGWARAEVSHPDRGRCLHVDATRHQEETWRAAPGSRQPRSPASTGPC